MSWGRASKQEPSALSKVLPLLIVLIIVATAGWIGYHIYLSARQIGTSASERMGKKNVVFTKDGLKVGVKSVETENYVDKTQSVLVKAWTLGKEKEEADAPLKKTKSWKRK